MKRLFNGFLLRRAGFLLCFALLGLSLSAGTFDQLQPVRLATGMKFTEGPAWHPDGFLVFSDIDGNVVYKWSETTGLDTLVYPSGKSNGILYDTKGGFFVCRQGARDVATMTATGKLTSLVSSYKGKKFNSPNDMELSPKGTVFFTDPDFGANASSRELPFQGLFCLPAGKKEAVLLDSTLNWPNGLTFVDDSRTLYLCESRTNIIYTYRLTDDYTVKDLSKDKQLFVKVAGNGLVDGIATDGLGRIYVAFNRGGIRIFDKQATEIGQIAFPAGEEVRNLCFGGSKRNILFVTSGKSLYKIELAF